MEVRENEHGVKLLSRRHARTKRPGSRKKVELQLNALELPSLRPLGCRLTVLSVGQRKATVKS